MKKCRIHCVFSMNKKPEIIIKRFKMNVVQVWSLKSLGVVVLDPDQGPVPGWSIQQKQQR